MNQRTLRGHNVSDSMIGVVEASLIMQVSPENVNRWCMQGICFAHSMAYKDANGFYWSIPLESIDMMFTFHEDELRRASARWVHHIAQATQLAWDVRTENEVVCLTDQGHAYLADKQQVARQLEALNRRSLKH